MHLPWTEGDVSQELADQMRAICLKRCPALEECRAEVHGQIAAGVLVVGMRAGRSQRSRAIEADRSAKEATNA